MFFDISPTTCNCNCVSSICSCKTSYQTLVVKLTSKYHDAIQQVQKLNKIIEKNETEFYLKNIEFISVNTRNQILELKIKTLEEKLNTKSNENNYSFTDMEINAQNKLQEENNELKLKIKELQKKEEESTQIIINLDNKIFDLRTKLNYSIQEFDSVMQEKNSCTNKYLELHDENTKLHAENAKIKRILQKMHRKYYNSEMELYQLKEDISRSPSST